MDSKVRVENRLNRKHRYWNFIKRFFGQEIDILALNENCRVIKLNFTQKSNFKLNNENFPIPKFDQKFFLR